MKQSQQLHNLFSEMRQTTQSLQQLRVENAEHIDLAAFQRFVESLTIITKQGKKTSLIFNPAQEQVWHTILGHWEKQEPAGGVCCKSRQEGVSTLIEGVCFSAVTIYPNKFAEVVAQDWKAALHIFGMTQRFYRYLPKDWKERRPLLSDTNKMLLFAPPHDSRFAVATANNASLSSGETIHFLHLSEVAKYKDPPAFDAITSVMQCVPDHWFTLKFWESTAKGKYGIFYDYYQGAKSGDIPMDPIFLTWKGFPEYFIAPPEGWKADWTQEERDYKGQYKLSDGDLLWASKKRREDCHNRWDQFNQEYPINDEVAFIWTGHAWFEAEAMTVLKTGKRPPLRVGNFDFTSEIDPIVEFKEAA